MTDARFEDGAERALRLVAHDAADVPVLSALVQDAVLSGGDLTFDRKRRQFAALINRFRWEDRAAAETAGRPYERVRSVLLVQDVLSVRSQGIDPRDRDTVLAILSIGWQPAEDGTGTVTLMLAGDGTVALSVEALDLTLTDVTRPYAAPSRKVPSHPQD